MADGIVKVPKHLNFKSCRKLNISTDIKRKKWKNNQLQRWVKKRRHVKLPVSVKIYQKNFLNKNVSKCSKATQTSETKIDQNEKIVDSTIHLTEYVEDDDFEDDDDYEINLPNKQQKALKETTVMSQYGVAANSSTKERNLSEEKNPEASKSISSSSEDSFDIFLVSGLRPLRSGESLLHLSREKHERTQSEDEIDYSEEEQEPLLEDLEKLILPLKPFEEVKPKDSKRRESSILEITPTEERMKSVESDIIEPIPKERRKKSIFKFFKKDDFCVHTKDLGKDIAAVYSDQVLPERRKKKSIFGFLMKSDFCIHSRDPPEDKNQSSSILSILNKKWRKSNERKESFYEEKRSSSSLVLPPQPRRSGFMLMSNRERRRLKN